MIVRPLPAIDFAASEPDTPRTAWHVFLEIEKRAKPPFAIIFQPEHSQLAGELAKALTPGAFGGLPPDVLQAIAEHDFGWKGSDEEQMRAIADKPPRPFPALSTEERLIPALNSVAHGHAISPLGYYLISRHFTTLALADPAQASFISAESERRAQVEKKLTHSPAELAHWIAALGFCDLLSLYLCCGARQTVQIPLAHPSDPVTSAKARTVTLSWRNDSLTFSAPVLKSGSRVSLDARVFTGQGTALAPIHLEWQFPDG